MTFLGDVTVAQLDADPFPIYARMRREQPVAYVPTVDTWFVTRFADVAFVAETPALFTAEHGESPVEITFGRPTIITVDGAEHHDLRRSFDGKFRPRVVQAYIDDLVRPLANRHVGELDPRGQVDLMATYFEPISVNSLAAVLGLGDLTSDVLRRWFKGMNLGATNFERDPDKQVASDRVLREIDEVVVPRMEHLSNDPDDSTMAQLLHAGRARGCPRDIAHVLPSLKVAILGGMQEPGHGAGTTLVGLLENPEQWQAVIDDPTLLARAVDEGMRWVAPIGTQLRTATTAIELGGVTIPAGAGVSAILASANRDEDVFDNPDQFDLWRMVRRDDEGADSTEGAKAPRPAQAAFGFGKHFCSGHSFARHQMRIALEVLVERWPAMHLTRTPTFSGWEFRAPTELVVTLSP